MCVGCGFIKFSSVFLLDSHQYSDQRDQTGQKNGASGMESTPRCCWSGALVWVGPIRHLCVAPAQLGHHHVHCYVHLLVDNVDQQCTNPYHFNCHCQKIDILITTAEARLCPKSFDRVDLVPGNIFLESNYQPN